MRHPHIRKNIFRRRITGSAILGWMLPFVAAAQATGRPGSLLGGRLRDRIFDITRVFGRNAGLQETSLSSTVARVIFMFLSLLGLIFVGLITYAGYHWVTARGNEEKVKKAQDTIRQAVWGLLIVLAAYSISYFILAYLLGEFSNAPPPPLGGGGT